MSEANYSIRIHSWSLGVGYGHAGINVVDGDGNIIASVDGGPQDGEFWKSAGRDDVPLVTNDVKYHAPVDSNTGEEKVLTDNQPIVVGLTREQALKLIEDAEREVREELTEADAQYTVPWEPGSTQNSNTVADMMADNIYEQAVEEGVGIAFEPDMGSMNQELPGHDTYEEGYEWTPVNEGLTDGQELFLAAFFPPLYVIYKLFLEPKPCPLVLDLDGDGIELTALEGSSAHFDLNINGFAELTGWVSPDDALLALDVNGDGIINDGSELFGDQTGHDHGFLALDVNGINVNRMSARAINLNAANDNHAPSIKPAA